MMGGAVVAVLVTGLAAAIVAPLPGIPLVVRKERFSIARKADRG